MTSAFGEMPSSRATFLTSARNGGIAADTSVGDFLAVAGGLDVALAEMQHVTARLHLARAPQVLLRHDDVGEQVGTRHDAAGGDDFAELERKRIERAPQLALDDQQRRIEACLVPLRRMRGAPIEIVDGQALDDGARARAVAECCNHPEAIAEDLLQLRGQRVDAHRSMLTVHRSPFNRYG